MLINRLTDNLVLTVMDYNDHRKDTELGASIFELSKLDEDATQEDLSLPMLKDGKEKGELRFDVSYFPVLKPQVDESGVEELPESSTSPSFFCDPSLIPASRRRYRAIHSSSGQGPRYNQAAYR